MRAWRARVSHPMISHPQRLPDRSSQSIGPCGLKSSPPSALPARFFCSWAIPELPLQSTKRWKLANARVDAADLQRCYPAEIRPTGISLWDCLARATCSEERSVRCLARGSCRMIERAKTRARATPGMDGVRCGLRHLTLQFIFLSLLVPSTERLGHSLRTYTCVALSLSSTDYNCRYNADLRRRSTPHPQTQSLRRLSALHIHVSLSMLSTAVPRASSARFPDVL